MPGIVGLITNLPRRIAEPQLLRMVETLRHEAFYQAGTWMDEALGVYVGWVVRKGSFAEGMPLRNERGDVALVFAGEEFPELGTAQKLRKHGHSLDAEGPSYLVHLYEDDASFPAADELAQDLRLRRPLVASDSIDLVVSNCVLNLVEPNSKRQLFEEIFRVLRKGGRAVIADIVSDEPVPERLQEDPKLWSGCISGALTEERFLQSFADAGFYGMQMLERDEHPWRTVEGIEFRAMTLRAFKGKQDPCLEPNQAVISQCCDGGNGGCC